MIDKLIPMNEISDKQKSAIAEKMAVSAHDIVSLHTQTETAFAIERYPCEHDTVEGNACVHVVMRKSM